MLAHWKKSSDKLTQHIKKQRYYFANKVHIVKAMIFPVVMYGYEIWTIKNGWKKNGWAPKNWCFQTLVLEKTLESLLDCKEVKPVNPRGNQPWIVTGRTNAEDEARILWPPDAEMTLFTSGSGFSSPWCWEKLNTEGERGSRGWDG